MSLLAESRHLKCQWYINEGYVCVCCLIWWSIILRWTSWVRNQPCFHVNVMFIGRIIFILLPWHFMTLSAEHHRSDGVFSPINKEVNKQPSCTIPGHTSWVWADPYFREEPLHVVHHGCRWGHPYLIKRQRHSLTCRTSWVWLHPRCFA